MCSALNNFRVIQLGRSYWIIDLQFADDIGLLREKPATVPPVLDRIVSEAMTIGITHIKKKVCIK